MKVRKLSIVIVIVMLFSIMAGCGQKAEKPNTTPTEKTTGTLAESSSEKSGEEAEISGEISVWTFLDPDGGTDPRSRSFAKMIENFEAEYDVDVKVEPQQFDLLTSMFLASAQTGTAPDIIWLYRNDVPMLINEGVLAPLEDTALKGWSEEEIKDISGGLFNVFKTSDGYHYAKDFGIGAYMIIYRKDIFEKEGIKYPFETWEDLIEAAKKLTYTDPKTGMDVYGLGMPLIRVGPDPTILHSILATAMDSQIFNPDGTAGWNGPEGLESLKFIKSLIYDHKIVPEDAINTQNDPLIQQFLAGKFAMISAPSLRMSAIRESIDICDPLDVQIMPLPKYKGKSTLHNLSGWMIGINADSKNMDASSAFFRHLISPESDLIWVKEAGQNPSRRSTVKNNMDFFGQPENEFFIPASEAINDSSFFPVNPKGHPVTAWTTDILQIVEDSTVGGMTEQEALDVSVEAFNKRNIPD